MIFVCVGSRSYPFSRLFQVLDALCESGALQGDEIFAQTGTSRYQPKHYAFQPYLTNDLYRHKISAADVVISHGASGSIVEALKARKKVIAVARLAKYGEHIDDHQIQLIQAFESHEHVLAVYDLEKLGQAVLALQEGRVQLKEWHNDDPLSVVRAIGQFIQQDWYGST